MPKPVVKTSDAPLRHLAVSTMEQPEAAEDPGSGRGGVMTGTAPGSAKAGRRNFAFYRAVDDVDYRDGE